MGALSLGACSAGGNNDAGDFGEVSSATVGTSDANPSEDNTTTGAAGEATSLLPVDAVAPTGYTMVTARCAATAATAATDAAAKSDSATPADVHRSPIVFAVPDAWSAMGSGTGGSGTVLSNDADVEFDRESGERVTVDYEWDDRTSDGGIADSSGRSGKTFDYDVSTADKTTTITYDKVATVTVGDQDVDLYYRDPSQAPNDLSKAQYKARINAVEMPRSQMEPNKTTVQSFVVTIEFDPATAVTQDVVETIVGSYNMPTCTWDDLLEEEELTLQIDLNGDGRIMSMADIQKQLQDQMDALEKTRS